jgi:hypothetical protein
MPDEPRSDPIPQSAPPSPGEPRGDDAPDDPSYDADAIRRRRVSRRTRQLLKDLHQRTWELELFISGAVTFVLAQLPARVDAVYFAADPFLADGAGLAAFMTYYYVKLTLYTLVGGFGAHLLTRALWVALVGLDSVFPRGIRWSELKLGPNMRTVLPETVTSVREMIVRTDGVASVIFAISFSLVAIFGLSVVVAVVFGGGAWLLLSLLPVEAAPAPVLLAVVLTASLLLTLPPLLDRRYGDRLAPGSLASRGLRGLLRWMLRLQGLPIYGSIQYTLASQLGSARYGWGIGIFIAGLVSFFLVKDVVVGQGNLTWSSTGAVPVRAGPLGVEPQHYEDYRARRRAAGEYVEPYLPTIQRETLGADELWVRLFIPYRPGSDPDRLELLCPDLDPGAGVGLRRNRITRGTPADSLLVDDVEALACLASVWQVEIDGIPAEAEPLFMRHPETGMPGIVRYLDVRTLAPGRHLVTVRRNPDGLEPDEDGAPRRPLQYDISVWR